MSEAPAGHAGGDPAFKAALERSLRQTARPS
jgi:hypothetical protein